MCLWLVTQLLTILKKERDNNEISNNFLNPGVPRPVFLELKIRSTKGLNC